MELVLIYFRGFQESGFMKVQRYANTTILLIGSTIQRKQSWSHKLKVMKWHKERLPMQLRDKLKICFLMVLTCLVSKHLWRAEGDEVPRTLQTGEWVVRKGRDRDRLRGGNGHDLYRGGEGPGLLQEGDPDTREGIHDRGGPGLHIEVDLFTLFVGIPGQTLGIVDVADPGHGFVKTQRRIREMEGNTETTGKNLEAKSEKIVKWVFGLVISE